MYFKFAQLFTQYSKIIAPSYGQTPNTLQIKEWLISFDKCTRWVAFNCFTATLSPFVSPVYTLLVVPSPISADFVIFPSNTYPLKIDCRCSDPDFFAGACSGRPHCCFLLSLQHLQNTLAGDSDCWTCCYSRTSHMVGSCNSKHM